MEKYIQYEKLSEKKKRALNERQRGSWGVLNPVTRKTENGKSYSRKKARQWNEDVPLSGLFLWIEQSAKNAQISSSCFSIMTSLPKNASYLFRKPTLN